MAIKNFARRTILSSTATAALTALLPSISRAKVPTPDRPRPNILFILADDLGYADLSCYGRRDYTTPVLDRLAREGTRFSQAYANSAVCSATRTALMTGRYQNRLAIGLEEPLTIRDVGLPPSHPTLPSLMRNQGYETALIGKWHLGELPNYGPLKSGYNHFWGFRGGSIDYFTHDLLGRGDLWDNNHPIEQAGYITDMLGDRTIKTIGEYAQSKKQFLISLHFSAPHWPWEGPEDEDEARRLSGVRNPADLGDYKGGSLKTYADMVTRMDMQIGRILSELEKQGIADNTIVIFTSDNGGERFSDTWPFSGRKTELLEGGLRIPAIIRWPGHVPAGVVNDQVIMSMDWLPTLLAAAGANPDPNYLSDGIDLLPVLTGQREPGPRSLFWRYMNLSQEACRDGDWKYLKILENTYLFNVVEDPLERANLKDRHPDIYERIIAKYRDWNAHMLPIDPAAATRGFTGAEMADRFGVAKPRMTSAPD
jgi:arylsulfatase A-like enzyme